MESPKLFRLSYCVILLLLANLFQVGANVTNRTDNSHSSQDLFDLPAVILPNTSSTTTFEPSTVTNTMATTKSDLDSYHEETLEVPSEGDELTDAESSGAHLPDTDPSPHTKPPHTDSPTSATSPAQPNPSSHSDSAHISDIHKDGKPGQTQKITDDHSTSHSENSSQPSIADSKYSWWKIVVTLVVFCLMAGLILWFVRIGENCKQRKEKSEEDLSTLEECSDSSNEKISTSRV